MRCKPCLPLGLLAVTLAPALYVAANLAWAQITAGLPALGDLIEAAAFSIPPDAPDAVSAVPLPGTPAPKTPCFPLAAGDSSLP